MEPVQEVDVEIVYLKDRDGNQIRMQATGGQSLMLGPLGGAIHLNTAVAGKLWPLIKRFAETGKLSESMTEQIGNAFSGTAPRSTVSDKLLAGESAPLDPIPTLRAAAVNWLRPVLQAEAMEEALQELHHEVGLASGNLIAWSRYAGNTPFLVEWCNQRYTVEFYGSGSIMYKRVASPEEIEKEAAKK